MEDTDGKLFVLEGYIPTIGWNRKEASGYEGRRMGDSRQKGSRNDTAEPGSICGFQYFEIKDNKGFNGHIGQIV
jgi:hypothetical protein